MRDSTFNVSHFKPIDIRLYDENFITRQLFFHSFNLMLFDIHFKIVLFGGSEFVEMPKIDMFQLISPRAVLLNSLFRATRGERKVIVMQINGQKKKKNENSKVSQKKNKRLLAV